MTTWGLGATGETIADVITMIINSALSFWVFFPIFKIIFKRVPEDVNEEAAAAVVAKHDEKKVLPDLTRQPVLSLEEEASAVEMERRENPANRIS